MATSEDVHLGENTLPSADVLHDLHSSTLEEDAKDTEHHNVGHTNEDQNAALLGNQNGTGDVSEG